MKKSARFFLVLIALSGIATAFADVGGSTNKTGGRQDTSFLCQSKIQFESAVPASMCTDF
jgi:hypothetical protein